VSEVVVDSSAVLALLQGESGAHLVAATLPGALISAVNLSEVIAKLLERGVPQDVARASIEGIGLEVGDFDAAQAYACAELRLSTRQAGLSLGDRACLALAAARGLSALTADTAWSRVEGAQLVFIR
jgi:PIN domain nuclease of toxin-antitoxin system